MMATHPPWCARQHDADDPDAVDDTCDAELGSVDIGEREAYLVTLYHDPANGLDSEVWLAHRQGERLPVTSIDADAARALGELLIRAANLAKLP